MQRRFRYWLHVMQWSAVAAVLFVCAVANDAQAIESPLAAMTRRAVDRYIIPAYSDLVKTTAVLQGQVQLFCQAKPAASEVEMLQPVIASWSRVEFLHFGPMADKNRQDRFAFWPDPKGTGPRQLRQFMASLAAGKIKPENIANQSAAIQGLPALEMLLAGDFGDIRSGEGAAQRCGVAKAIAANLAMIAKEADSGWHEYRAIMVTPGPQNPLYRNDQEAATEILKALSTGFQQLREQRILLALGGSDDEAKPKRAPYYRSGLTLSYLKESARALHDFAIATAITDLLPDDSKWIANSITFEFANLNRTIDKLTQNKLFEDDANRDAMTYVTIVLKSLQDQFAVRLSGAINLSPGFNALDGD